MTTSPSGVTEERGVLAWHEFGDASRELAAIIVDDGFIADVVVATAR